MEMKQEEGGAAAQPPSKRIKVEQQPYSPSKTSQSPHRPRSRAPTSSQPSLGRTSGVPAQIVSHHPMYGRPIHVKDRGQFPKVGSILGPFFCLGELGKGTFSSVHKCVNLEYHQQDTKSVAEEEEKPHTSADRESPKKSIKTEDDANDTNSAPSTASLSKRRLAAAKVELKTFVQSGVLESEATILHFLHSSLPPNTVPVYMGHYKSSRYAAILMEFLPGEDMNQLREAIVRQGTSRRIHVQDAVYLTADVFLPLLQRMHSVGMIHRDVKPSNAVRMEAPPHVAAAASQDDDTSSCDFRAKFCLVDFGLSKSIIVPHDAKEADLDHPWPEDRPWLKPANYQGRGFIRQERPKADFRGSSMYASLRVHQERDYCPRDDVWSVLYVFCDLVSGGLPWMTNAANKERNECLRLKEEIQESLQNGSERMHELLQGDEYHVARHRREQKLRMNKNPNELRPLPSPLDISKDSHKIQCLRKAFDHVASLQFWDTPDYDLVAKCIRGFLDDTSNCPEVARIQWKTLAKPSFTPLKSVDTASLSLSQLQARNQLGENSKKIPEWNIVSELGDPAVLANTDMFNEAQEQAFVDQSKEQEPETNEMGLPPIRQSPESEQRSKLPITMQFALEQMASHVQHVNITPKHICLRDWFQVVLPLLHKDWNVSEYEASHRSRSDDGYRRDHYLKLLKQCLEWAKAFGYFRSKEYFFHQQDKRDNERTFGRPRTVSTRCPDKNGSLIMLSKALVGLKVAIEEEQKRSTAPPSRISFGS